MSNLTYRNSTTPAVPGSTTAKGSELTFDELDGNFKSLNDTKQDSLVSGTNIKTINSTSLVGTGDVAVQATLVSATNIKSINSASILGSGNLVVAVPGAQTAFTAQQYFAETTLTDGATINWACDTNQVTKVTLGGNRTLAAPTGMTAGCFYALAVIQDATGSRTLAWNAAYKFIAGTAPTLSTAASSKDYFTFRSDGTNLYEQGRAQGVA